MPVAGAAPVRNRERPHFDPIAVDDGAALPFCTTSRSSGISTSNAHGARNPMDLIDAAVQRDIVLLLAVIVVVLAGAVGYLFRLVVSDLKDRVKRAEHLTDTANAANDKLAALFDAALNELRGK